MLGLADTETPPSGRLEHEERSTKQLVLMHVLHPQTPQGMESVRNSALLELMEPWLFICAYKRPVARRLWSGRPRSCDWS